MRTGSGGWVWAALVLAAVLVTGEARAFNCQACGGDMFCHAADAGAFVCIGSGDACLMGGRCRRAGPSPHYEGSAVIQLTVLDDAPGLGAIGRSRVVRGAGPLAVGRHAQRLAREAAGGGAAEPAIVFSGVGTGEGATVAFRSRQGDGFTLRRDAEGRGARVQVRALVAGRPGLPLARETLGEHDVLVVRVTLEGRTRVVVVQAPTLGADEGAALEREARFALRGANGARPGPQVVPFEMAPVHE